MRQSKFSKIAWNFLEIFRKKFIWIFSSIRIFWAPKFLSRNEIIFSLYNVMPKIIEQHKKFPIYWNFSSILENIFQKFSIVHNFLGNMKKILSFCKLPKHFGVVLKTLPMQMFQYRVKLTPSYNFIYPLCVNNRRVSLFLIF
jgi:hypothetical protein